MLHAIAHVHASKIVHCDIKPHNIFVHDEQPDPAKMMSEGGGGGSMGAMMRRATRIVLGDFDFSIDMQTRTIDPTRTMRLYGGSSSSGERPKTRRKCCTLSENVHASGSFDWVPSSHRSYCHVE